MIRARCTLTYIACRATVRINGAPLIELSSYPFSKYTNFVAVVDLASILLHKLRREISKNEVQQTDSDRQKPGSNKLTLITNLAVSILPGKILN